MQYFLRLSHKKIPRATFARGNEFLFYKLRNEAHNIIVSKEDVLKDIRAKSIGTTNVLNNQDNKFLWGKNFPLNSEIKYEYFADGIHSSYPDFVMKDKKGRIHIFEVKSVNKSPLLNINDEEYESKVKSLKKCYKACSKKTKHIFYLPILDGNTWKITKFENGEETTIDKNTFIDSLNFT